MNAKQLGMVVVLLGILLVAQLGQSFRNKARALNVEVATAGKEQAALATQLQAERDVFEYLQRQSKDLL